MPRVTSTVLGAIMLRRSGTSKVGPQAVRLRQPRILIKRCVTARCLFRYMRQFIPAFRAYYRQNPNFGSVSRLIGRACGLVMRHKLIQQLRDILDLLGDDMGNA